MSVPVFTAQLTPEDHAVYRADDAAVVAGRKGRSTAYLMRIYESNENWESRHITNWRARVRKLDEWATARSAEEAARESKRVNRGK